MNINRKTVKISEINNFIENPRTETAKTPEEEIKFIYGETSTSRKSLMNLVKSIAEKGYDIAESIVVVSEKGNYIVYDGNRRVAALKLLLNPENFDFLTPNDLTQLMNLKESTIIPEMVEVVIKSKEDALDYMQRLHGGQQKGVGHTDWSAENKRKFDALRGHPELTYIINDGFEREFGYSVTEEMPVTTIDRIIRNKQVKEKLNIQKDQKYLDRETLEEVRSVLQKVNEISKESGQPVTRAFATKQDIEEKLLPLLDKDQLEGEVNASNTIDDGVETGEKIGPASQKDETRTKEERSFTPKTQEKSKSTKVIPNKLLFPKVSKLPADSSNETVKLVRNLMTILNQLWTDKNKYAPVVATSLRTIFELPFNELRAQGQLSLGKGSKIDDKNILEGLLRNIAKSNDLSKVVANIGDSYNAIKNQFLLNSSGIINMYNIAHDGAHRSTLGIKNVDIEDIANKAEYFAIIALHFVLLGEKNEQ